MAFENTVTDNDLDASSQRFVQSLHSDDLDIEPDLSVDGLSESIFSRLLGLLGIGGSKH